MKKTSKMANHNVMVFSDKVSGWLGVVGVDMALLVNSRQSHLEANMG